MSLKRKPFLFITIGMVLFGALLLLPMFAGERLAFADARVELGGHTFHTKVVKEDAERAKGLSDSRPLSKNQAMLFVFPFADTHGIWMKDMRYAIDIIWLDEAQKVIHVQKEARPDSYPQVFKPEENAAYVLEVAAGSADSFGISVGKVAHITYQKEEE